MAQNPNFAVQLLEKIGAPLAAAVESVPLEGEGQDVEAAKLMAKMLGQAVRISIALSGTLDLKEDEQQADSTRVALAAIAAPLIGNFYTKNAKVPEEQDIKRLTKSLESVLVFAENFTAASDESSRLATVSHDSPLFDTSQPLLVTLQNLTPVINAVADFPFGLSETKLVQDVSERLEKDAAEIATGSQLDDKFSQLLIFKALAKLYAECHLSETSRLLSSSDDNRGELSLDPVWEKYETKLAMMRAVTGVGETGAASSSAGAPVPDTSVPENNPEPPMPAEMPEAPVQQPQVAPTESTPAAAPASGGPMGFFAKKPVEQGEAQPAAPPTEPAAPPEAVPTEPPAEQPPPPPQEPETPATPPPEAAPPAPQDPPAQPAEPQGDPSNPMSFFKPGKSEENGGEQ